MAEPTKNRFWRAVRRFFRWCRMWILFLILLAVGAIAYFNTIGLPDFLKRPLVAELREHGWEVQFSRMRSRSSHWDISDKITLSPGFSPLTTSIVFTELRPSCTGARSA